MKYLKVFTDFVEKIEELGDAERGRLFTAMLQYASTGAGPELRGNEKILWATARQDIDRQRNSYDSRCETNKRIATNRYESLRDSTKKRESCQDKDNCAKAPLRFVPPSLSDVQKYCMERNNGIDPQAFIDFYTQKGWMVGKTKMVDWKAAVRTWENRRKQEAAPEPYQKLT